MRLQTAPGLLKMDHFKKGLVFLALGVLSGPSVALSGSLREKRKESKKVRKCYPTLMALSKLE